LIDNRKLFMFTPIDIANKNIIHKTVEMLDKS
jgi:hypothetical protein